MPIGISAYSCKITSLENHLHTVLLVPFCIRPNRHEKRTLLSFSRPGLYAGIRKLLTRGCPGYPQDLGEKTRLIIDAALDAIIGINTQGEIIIWNPQAAAIFGWTKDEILGQPLAERIVPERFREKHDRGFKLYLQTGIHTTLNRKLEISAINRWGNEFPIELSILPIKEGSQEFFCAFIRDISDRKRAEQTLLQQKEFSETLIDSLPGIFYLFDEKGNYLVWNQNLEKVSGYSAKEISGLHPLDFFEGDDKNYILERIQKVFTEGIADAEALLVTKDGRKIPYLFTGKFIEMEGKPCLMGMGIDMSEKVRLQKELDYKMRQVQQGMTTAVITAQETERSQLGQELHDNVNQVLTTVKLYTEMLRDGIGHTEDLFAKSLLLQQSCINEIRSISKRLSAPTLGNISLTESIKELVESINLTKRVNIIYSIEGLVNKEISQEVHLAVYRIVQEQLNNIIKYAHATFATITIRQREAILTLHIKDDGQGFDPSAKRTGIGLNNMKTRAESLGGQFSLKSAPGSGCEMQAVIPLQKEASATRQSAFDF